MALSISRKIGFGFGAGILGLIAMGVVAWLALAGLYQDASVGASVRDVRDTLRAAREDHLRWLLEVEGSLLDEHVTRVDVEGDPRSCAFGRWYYSSARRDKERQIPGLAEPLEQLEPLHDRLHQSAHRIDELLSSGRRQEAINLLQREVIPLSQSLSESFDQMIDMINAELDQRNMVARTRVSQLVVGGLAGFLSLLVAVVAVFIGRDVTLSLRGAVATITTSTTEIAATLAQHERAVVQQSTAVTETTTTVEELGASARQSAEQAETAANAARGAVDVTEEGIELATQAGEGMSAMKERMEEVASQILRLSEQAGQIGTIASVVGELASETNMLALNAAVEAARAGEHGRGFAVVANEVRKLADQSKKSAQRANALVAEIQRDINSAVMVTEDGTRSGDEVTRIAGRVGEAFHSLNQVAHGVFENAQQVRLNARQQVGALVQVSEAMQSLSSGAHQMADGTAQTRTGMEQLDALARDLKARI